MDLICESSNRNDYLIETDLINYSHPSIKAKADEISQNIANEVEFVHQAFEFVRDEVNHSWDIQSPRVTIRASDVLKYKEGICYAKSLLLCALLRNKGIPTGFCYQRLTLGDTPDTGYALHALNAVYLSSLNRWIRLDARGNKESINAQFSIHNEQLAFPVREPFAEIDYPTIYINPHASTISVLKRATNCLIMYQNDLPTEL